MIYELCCILDLQSTFGLQTQFLDNGTEQHGLKEDCSPVNIP